MAESTDIPVVVPSYIQDKNRVTSQSSPEVLAMQKEAVRLVTVEGLTKTAAGEKLGVSRTRVSVLLLPVIDIPVPPPPTPGELDRQAKIQAEIEEVEARLKARRKAIADYLEIAPHLKFQPNPSQYGWLQMIQKGIDEGKMKFGVFDGNSSGKTLWLVNLIYNIMSPAEGRNPWFDVPFIRNWKWGHHIRLVCKADDIKDESGMIWQLIKNWWPATEFSSVKQDRSHISLIKHKVSKFYISIRTFDQPIEAHDDGSTIAFAPFNEPPPASVWNSYPARMREGGFMLATATLVRESEFFKDDVMDNPNAQYSMGSLEGNCRQHARLTVENPWHKIDPIKPEKIELAGTLEHDNLENIIKNSPLREQISRRTGRPLHLSGAAFNVVRTVHFVPRSRLPKIEDCQCSILSLDPHQRRPWAVSVLLKDRHNRFWVADEWPRITTLPWKMPYHKIDAAGVGRQFYVDAIKALKKQWQVRDINCVIDSKFAGQIVTQEDDALKLREILWRKHGLKFQSGATAVRGEGGGIDLLEDYLSYDQTEEVCFENSPRLMIVEDCWNTDYQLENVTWNEYADADRFGQKEVLDEKYLDFPRLIMYGIMHRASHTRLQPTAEQQRQHRESTHIGDIWKKVSADFPQREVSDRPTDDVEDFSFHNQTL